MSIITNSELQKKFDSLTENSLNRKILIENAIREVEDFVENIPIYTSPFKRVPKPPTTNKSPKFLNFEGAYIDRKIFNEAFYEYLNNGKALSIVQEQNDNNESFIIKQNSVEQSIELFKYYEWLKKQLPLTTKKIQSNPTLYLNDKLLALHFLGLDTSDYENNKCAEVLAQILDVDSENIRKALSYLYNDAPKNPVRTKSNLEKASQLFEKQGLTTITSKIKSLIEKS